MDLEQALYLVLQPLIPNSDGLLRLLTQDACQLLRSPSRTVAQLYTLIERYKNSCIEFSNLPWEKIGQMLKILVPMQEKEVIDILTAYQPTSNTAIENIYSLIQSPTRLNGDMLINHNNYSSPLKVNSAFSESNDSMDRRSDRRSIILSQGNAMTSRHQAAFNSYETLKSLVDPFFGRTIPEQDFLPYVFYALLAGTSDMFPFNVESCAIIVHANIPNSVSQVLHLIMEGGLIYCKLSQLIEYQSGRLSKDVSPVKKALLSEISKHLQNYSGFVNSLSSSDTLPTLRTLYVELYPNVHLLRLYLRLMNGFEKQSGDDYLSRLYTLKLHGDNLVRRSSTILFESLLSVYYGFITDWLTLGKLDTSFNEIFISTDINDQEGDATIPYKFIRGKVPSFIPLNIAEKIFVIGYSYNFVQDYCMNLEWINAFTKKYQVEYKRHENFGTSKKFEKLVENQYQEIIEFINSVIRKKFYFVEIILALKNIMFMARGDFIESLTVTCSDLLMQPSSSISSYGLTRALQDSVQQSSLRYWVDSRDKNHVINGLDARLMAWDGDFLGWDIFTLDYIVKPPISIVLNVNSNGSRKEYLRVFNFLWKFRRNYYLCKEQWVDTNDILRSMRKIARYNPLMKDIATKLSKTRILMSQYLNFNSKLHEFCTQSIIEKSFKTLCRKLNIKEELGTCAGSGYPKTREKGSSGAQYFLRESAFGLCINGILTPVNQAYLSNLNKTYGPAKPVVSNENSKDSAQATYDIEQLQQVHGSYLQSILTHKLLMSNNPEQKLGSVSNKAYSASLIGLLQMVFEFIELVSTLTTYSRNALIEFNLANTQNMEQAITRLNSGLASASLHHKQFSNLLGIFIDDLRLDGNEELLHLSKLLQ